MRAQHLCRKRKRCHRHIHHFKRRCKCKKIICCKPKRKVDRLRVVPAFGTAITDPALIFTDVLGIPAGPTPFTNFQPVVAENVIVENTGIRIQRRGCYEVGGAASIIVFVGLATLTAPLSIALTLNGTVIPGTETTLVATGGVLDVGVTFTTEIPERQIFLREGDLIDLTFIAGAAVAAVAVGITGVLGVGRVPNFNCGGNGFTNRFTDGFSDRFDPNRFCFPLKDCD
ncbi:hypothetical protein [Laceyella putida]|uniref:Uncharacterized protein n=1 Tax=Laceyella putida TaxID=110101 RepID=A0ABW2RKY3_9BACL